MNNYFKYIIILLFIPLSSYSQLFQRDYSTRNDSLFIEKNLNLHLLAATFLNNNEFFNPYQKGYTLIGGFLQPTLNYSISHKLILSAGVHFRKYFGDEGFADSEPVFRIKYIPVDDISFLAGSFEGGQNHGLPETVFAFENHFSNLVENGILLNINKSFLQTEAWLDWEKFIKPGDPFREEFTAGISNRVKLYEENEYFHVEIPVFFLAHHSGGQINNTYQPVQSLYNLAEGIKITLFTQTFTTGLAPYIEILMHHTFGDYATGYGYANQFTAGAEMNSLEVNAGFFKGNNFASFKGLPLYTSFKENINNEYTLGGINSIFSFKAGYKKKIADASFMFIRFESYYNSTIRKFDYTFGIHMQVNDLINITTLNK